MTLLRQYKPADYQTTYDEYWADIPACGWNLSQLSVRELFLLGGFVQLMNIYSKGGETTGNKPFLYLTPCLSLNNAIIKELWSSKLVALCNRGQSFLQLPVYSRQLKGDLSAKLLVTELGVNKTADARLIAAEIKSRSDWRDAAVDMLRFLSVGYYVNSYRYGFESRVGCGVLSLIEFNIYSGTIECVENKGLSLQAMRHLGFRMAARTGMDSQDDLLLSGKDELSDYTFNEYFVKAVHGFDPVENDEVMVERLAHTPLFSMERFLSMATGQSMANLNDCMYVKAV